MPVVSNTSPLLNLAVIGHLDLLRQQFGEVWIPPGVVGELRVGEGLPGSAPVAEAIEAGWIQVTQVADQALVSTLQRELDQGEAEAIALALQVQAARVLLDEREGRRVAKMLGLQVTGVLGVLLRAREAGHLPSLRDSMERLRNEAGFHIGDELSARVLREGGET
jgi:predicted nucleic acid-binding protein